MPHYTDELFNAIPDALLIINQAGEILWGNRKVKELLGYDVETLINRPVEILIPQALRKSHITKRNDFIASPAHRPMDYSGNLEALCQNGSHVPVDIELSTINWEGQKCALAVLRSKIRRRAQEQAQQKQLRLNEERLRHSQAIAQIGSWDWDINSDQLNCSAEIFNILGVDKSVVCENFQALVEYIHPRDENSVLTALDNTLRYNLPFYVEHRICRPSGEIRHVREIGKVYRDDNGSAIRMLGTIQDITEDREKRLQLQMSQAIFDHAYEGILTIDNRFNIISANPALLKTSGFSSAELIGSRITVLLPSNQQNGYRLRPILKQVDQSGSWQGEIEFGRKNAPPCPALMSVSAIEDPTYHTHYYVIVLTDISNIKNNEAKLHQLAHYDQLTGLPNRRFFINSLNNAIEAANNTQQRFALHYIDLDGFKQVNDSQGHNAGDSLLLEVAQKLRDCAQGSALVARLGGDEFAVLQSDCSPEESETLALRLINNLQLRKEFPGLSLNISASIGIAHFPEDGDDGIELIKKADQAMYQSKEGGKNRFEHYKPALGEQLNQRIQLTSDIQTAINHQQFELHYQPKCIVSQPEVICAEALIRWPHPHRGYIPPMAFIPLAEESGQILKIGDQVLTQACQFIRSCNQFHQDIKLAINLSARQLHDRHLLDKIRTTIQETGICASQLEFEITESVVMHDVEANLTIFEKLKSMGAAIAIDDFGTGYSSLSYLKKLPVDTLKVDRSFTMSLPHSQDDVAIVSAIISMAHRLKIQVVAEGVETEAQQYLLTELGCEQLQGYLIGKPVDANRFKRQQFVRIEEAYLLD